MTILVRPSRCPVIGFPSSQCTSQGPDGPLPSGIAQGTQPLSFAGYQRDAFTFRCRGGIRKGRYKVLEEAPNAGGVEPSLERKWRP